MKATRHNKPANIKRAVVAGVTTMALAVSGCGSEGSNKYNSDTEKALKTVINPTMVDIAKKAVTLSAKYRDSFSKDGAPDGRVHLSYDDMSQPQRGGGPGSIAMLDVLMGTTNGKPDPNKVQTVEMSASNIDVGGMVKDSTNMSLSAPGNDIGNDHTDGWIASLSGGDVPTPVSSPDTFAFDTSNSKQFTASDPDPTPVSTAKDIVGVAPELVAQIEHDLATQPQ